MNSSPEEALFALALTKPVEKRAAFLDVMCEGDPALRQTIREKEPQRPSTRRYETANGLAADLKRHLDNEPVLARPPSAAYKFQKAFRRNKLVFAAGAAVATALIVGLTCSAWQAVRATRAEAQAIVEKAQAQKELAQHRYTEAESLLRESLELAERYWPEGEFRFLVNQIVSPFVRDKHKTWPSLLSQADPTSGASSVVQRLDAGPLAGDAGGQDPRCALEAPLRLAKEWRQGNPS